MKLVSIEAEETRCDKDLTLGVWTTLQTSSLLGAVATSCNAEIGFNKFSEVKNTFVSRFS